MVHGSAGHKNAAVTLSIVIEDSNGRRREVPARIGQSLMKAAVAAGVEGIAADCGGSLSCATCHVYVADAWWPRLTAAGADELHMLELTAAERRATSRLSCQIVIDDSLNGLLVHLPTTQY